LERTTRWFAVCSHAEQTHRVSLKGRWVPVASPNDMPGEFGSG
jgi:hypothetical protein